MAHGLIVGFRGPIKSMKTGTMVWWTRLLRARMSLRFGVFVPVYTNMQECICREKRHPLYGKHWAQHVTIDELILDIVKDPSLAKYRKGILMLDELHLLMSAEFMRGMAGAMLNGLVTQLGKRGMPLLYTTHLRSGVGPKLRDNTEIGVRCRTDNHGMSVLLNIRDEMAFRDALEENEPLPMDAWRVLRHAHKQWNWYETNEVIDPLSMSKSALGTKRQREVMKALNYLNTQDQGPAPATTYPLPIGAEENLKLRAEVDSLPVHRGRKARDRSLS